MSSAHDPIITGKLLSDMSSFLIIWQQINQQPALLSVNEITNKPPLIYTLWLHVHFRAAPFCWFFQILQLHTLTSFITALGLFRKWELRKVTTPRQYTTEELVRRMITDYWICLHVRGSDRQTDSSEYIDKHILLNGIRLEEAVLCCDANWIKPAAPYVGFLQSSGHRGRRIQLLLCSPLKMWPSWT